MFLTEEIVVYKWNTWNITKNYCLSQITLLVHIHYTYKRDACGT